MPKRKSARVIPTEAAKKTTSRWRTLYHFVCKYFRDSDRLVRDLSDDQASFRVLALRSFFHVLLPTQPTAGRWSAHEHDSTGDSATIDLGPTVLRGAMWHMHHQPAVPYNAPWIDLGFDNREECIRASAAYLEHHSRSASTFHLHTPSGVAVLQIVEDGDFSVPASLSDGAANMLIAYDNAYNKTRLKTITEGLQSESYYVPTVLVQLILSYGVADSYAVVAQENEDATVRVRKIL